MDKEWIKALTILRFVIASPAKGRRSNPVETAEAVKKYNIIKTGLLRFARNDDFSYFSMVYVASYPLFGFKRIAQSP